MSEIKYCEICEICNCIVVAEGGSIEVIDSDVAITYSTCNQPKNGYCGVFRAQAMLDQIEYNMHPRSV